MTVLLIAILARQDLEGTLRALEKDIAAARGLEFKSPVVAKVIERPQDAPKKIQGYYSTKDKALFLYRDISGAYERGVLVHEMVHALQDQHFGLAKLHPQTFGSDAELAMAALIEGDATFTMIELLRKDRPKVAAMLDAPVEGARDPQGAFLYAQGARYVKALKEKGGWAAVNAAYRNPPRATAQVLHPEGVRTLSVGAGTVRGELEILKLVGAKAAAGWIGDAYSEGAAKQWIVAFASREDAVEFQKAMAAAREMQNPHLAAFLDEPGAKAWTGPRGAVTAVLARGDRAFVLDAPDAAAFKAALDRLEGAAPAVAVWDARRRELITFGQMADRLLEADLVCVGETHDSEPHHRMQLQIIKALYARDESLGVGMEMFQRPFQKALDDYAAGRTTEEEFLKASEYERRWGFPWALYRPIVEFARRNGLPLAALNAPRELTQRISKVGVDGLTDEEKKELGDVDFHVKEHREHWFERLSKMHGARAPSEEQKERSYQVMAAWDEVMGRSAAEFQQSRRLRRMVVLAGSGHVDRGFGIAARAAKRTGGRAVTVHIALGGDAETLAADPPADFVVIVK
jgi:uncharacterized iron-regulated protein